MPALSQTDCMCGGPGTACEVCGAGRTCAAGWCEVTSDVCAYSFAMQVRSTGERWTAQAHETVQGLGSSVESCFAIMGIPLLTGGAIRLVAGVEIDIGYSVRPTTWPWGNAVSLAELGRRDASFEVNVASRDGAGNPINRRWAAGPSTPGTITITKTDAEPRPEPSNPLRRFSKERYVIEVEGTLFLNGTNAAQPLDVRVVAFEFPIQQ